MVVEGDTKELVLEAPNVKPLQRGSGTQKTESGFYSTSEGPEFLPDELP